MFVTQLRQNDWMDLDEIYHKDRLYFRIDQAFSESRKILFQHYFLSCGSCQETKKKNFDEKNKWLKSIGNI